MIDREKVMPELVKVFGEAWGAENRNQNPQGDYPPGARREAGLNAVLDVLERDREYTGQIFDLQGEIRAWINDNFGLVDTANAMLVLAEETGELARAIVKLRQGIRGTELEWRNQASLEIGDVFISLMSVAAHLGIDAEDAIADRWKTVSKRNWNVDKIQHGIEKT